MCVFSVCGTAQPTYGNLWSAIGLVSGFAIDTSIAPCCLRTLTQTFSWGFALLGMVPLFVCRLTFIVADPWAASIYPDQDNSPLRPWLSWGPTANKRAAVHGLLCRCWYLSNNGTARVSALTEALIMIHHRAFFPLAFISRCARKWAKEWIPRGASSPCRCLPDDVSQALARIPNLDEHAYCASVGCLTLSHTSKRHRHS